MRGQLFSLMMTLLFLVSLLTSLVWYVISDNNVEPQQVPLQKKSPPQTPEQKKNMSQLNTKCHGYDQAIVSQANTPVGTKLVYDGEKKRSLQVTPEIFSTFVKYQQDLQSQNGFRGLQRPQAS
ncbi:hypothetical protein INR49_017913 [Caranx melampygus]|nr:hypothetical protein INR49_017913 [Caranx melampygus]